MKNFILLLFLAIVTFANAEAQTKQSVGVDTLKIGNSASAHNPSIEFAGTNVKVRANKSTGNAEFTNDGSLWKKLGSGSGSGSSGINIIENALFNDQDLGYEYSSGTGTPAVGSFTWNPSTSGQYFRTALTAIPASLYGSACEAQVRYVGGDANIAFRVKNGAGTIMPHVVTGSVHPDPGYESVFFKCPTLAEVTANSLVGQIQVEAYQSGATDAAAVTFYKVHLGELIGLAETTTPDVLSARVDLSGTVTDESGGDWINGNCSKTATGAYTCTYTSGFFTVSPLCTITPALGHTQAGITTELATSISYVTKTTAGAAVDTWANITCIKAKQDAKQSVQVYKSIPRISANINVFPFQLNTGTGGTAPAVQADTFAIINSFTRPNTGIYNINYASLGLVNAPSVVCSTTEGLVEIDSATATDAQILIRGISGGAAVNMFVVLSCTLTKQFSDYKLPTVQPIVIGQVTNSAAESSLSNVRTEACLVNNDGTATIDTTTGLCGGWIQSVSRASAGSVTVNFKSGTFSAVPVCTFVPYSAGLDARSGRLTTYGINTIVVFTISPSAGIDVPFFLTCTGKR